MKSIVRNQDVTIQNSYPLISGIKRINKGKTTESMSIFYFWKLYTKILHDKLLYVLNEIADFAFKGGTRDYVTAYNSENWKILLFPRNKFLFGVLNKQQLVPGKF